MQWNQDHAKRPSAQSAVNLCNLDSPAFQRRYKNLQIAGGGWVINSPVTISLFPTSIDLDPIFEKDRDLDRFRFSNKAGQSVVLNTLDRRVSWGNAIISGVAAASSRRPPLLKSRTSRPLYIHPDQLTS